MHLNNARDHTAARTKNEYLNAHNIKIMGHLPYKPDLVPNDFLFSEVKYKLRDLHRPKKRLMPLKIKLTTNYDQTIGEHVFNDGFCGCNNTLIVEEKLKINIFFVNKTKFNFTRFNGKR